MQEFIYYSSQSTDIPLDESIFVTTSLDLPQKNYFYVSNCDIENCGIVANEIDFYLKNTEDTLNEKINNVKKLYDIALLRFDLAKDISYTQNVDNKVLLIFSKEEESQEFIKSIKVDEFDLYSINESILKSIDGHIGKLKVTVDNKGEDVILNISQIVWFDMKEEGLKQSGCFDPKISSIKEVVDKLRENIINYEYKKWTVYDERICQYHQRREEICSKCAEVCPTVAILKDDEKKELNFSQIDCHGCGGCISVCPSGALDYAPMSKDAIFELSCEFKGHIPLIIPNKMKIDNLEVKMPSKMLPFKIDGEKFLDESSFLTILQQSGAQIVFYTDFISKGSGDAIRILNDIYQRKYKKDAILVAMNEKELEEALQQVSFIDNSYFTYNQDGVKKRDNFSIRLAHLVGDDDLGVVKTGEHIHYAKVHVDESKCTLCLSCVGACNVDALRSYSDDFTLRLNPSLCTSCGYCLVSCPEKDCISIQEDVIELNPKWFIQSVVASDEMFKCIECDKDFATKKSIEKIANIMKPIFANDELKIRTLYCCEDCKPKVMFSNLQMENQLV